VCAQVLNVEGDGVTAQLFGFHVRHFLLLKVRPFVVSLASLSLSHTACFFPAG
jgi:hypothetical protein